MKIEQVQKIDDMFGKRTKENIVYSIEPNNIHHEQKQYKKIV